MQGTVTFFRIKDVSVEFAKGSLSSKSLKLAIASVLQKRINSPFFALRNINLEIREGEHIGIIGRNGSGKSTLLRVLSGVIIPQTGSIEIIRGKHFVPLLELGVGFHPELSGRENCFLAGTLMGYSVGEMKTRIQGIIEFSELGDFIDEPIKNLSSGMYARLAFALATDIEPEILFVDEVFGVGDEFFMRKCLIRMQRLMKAGTTTIFVSHNLDFLVTQCNRLIWLDRGRTVMDGNAQEVASAYRQAEGVLLT